jgi:hypothetical protein
MFNFVAGSADRTAAAKWPPLARRLQRGQNSIVTVTENNLQLSAQGNVSIGPRHGRRNFTDTNPLMSSLLVIFVWGGVAIL